MPVLKLPGASAHTVANETGLVSSFSEWGLAGYRLYYWINSAVTPVIELNSGGGYSTCTIVTTTPASSAQVRVWYTGYAAPFIECHSSAVGYDIRVSYSGQETEAIKYLTEFIGPALEPETPYLLGYAYNRSAGTITVTFSPYFSTQGTAFARGYFELYDSSQTVLLSYSGTDVGAVTTFTFNVTPNTDVQGYARVRYIDVLGHASAFSSVYLVGNYHAPADVGKIMASAVTATTINATLYNANNSAYAFSDSDPSHSHLSTTWEWKLTSNAWSSLAGSSANNAVDKTTYAITGLTGATNYDIRAKVHCAGGATPYVTDTGILTTTTHFTNTPTCTGSTTSSTNFTATTSAFTGDNWGHDYSGSTIEMQEVGGVWTAGQNAYQTYTGDISGASWAKAFTVASDKKYEARAYHTCAIAANTATSSVSTGVWVIGNAPVYNLVGNASSHMFGASGEWTAATAWTKSAETYGNFTDGQGTNADLLRMTLTAINGQTSVTKVVGSFAGKTALTLMMKMRINATTLTSADQSSYVSFRFHDGAYIGQFRISSNGTNKANATIYAMPAGTPTIVTDSTEQLPCGGTWFWLKCVYDATTRNASFWKAADAAGALSWTAIGANQAMGNSSGVSDGTIAIYGQEKYTGDWAGTKTVEIALLELY